MKKISNYKPIKKYILVSKFKDMYETFGIYNTTKQAIERMKILKERYFKNINVKFKISKVTFYERINN